MMTTKKIYFSIWFNQFIYFCHMTSKILLYCHWHLFVYISILLHASIVSNKALEGCNIWVNYRVPSFRATDSPGHNADKNTFNNHRAARITVASTVTFCRPSTTDHVLSNSVVNGISSIAFCTGCDVYIDRLELIPKGPVTMLQFSPATDYSKGISNWFCGGQRNWLNFWSVDEWNRYLKLNTDII
jgi:hypothetical protein